jgi:hypothetical protein
MAVTAIAASKKRRLCIKCIIAPPSDSDRIGEQSDPATHAGTVAKYRFRSRRFLGLAHDGMVANSACASAISGNSGVGLKPSSAELRMDFASLVRAID